MTEPVSEVASDVRARAEIVLEAHEGTRHRDTFDEMHLAEAVLALLGERLEVWRIAHSALTSAPGHKAHLEEALRKIQDIAIPARPDGR